MIQQVINEAVRNIENAVSKKFTFEKQPLEYLIWAAINGETKEVERKMAIIRHYVERKGQYYSRNTNFVFRETFKEVKIEEFERLQEILT